MKKATQQRRFPTSKWNSTLSLKNMSKIITINEEDYDGKANSVSSPSSAELSSSVDFKS